MFQIKSLVLYKQSPAVVSALDGDKIHIDLATGNKKVRPKDLFLLHPGPVSSLGAVEQLNADPFEAWELYQGEQPPAADLAEWIYGEFSPSAAWSLYLLLNRTQWFRGTFDAIEVTTPEEREAREKSDRIKQEAKEKLEAFKIRLGKSEFLPEDEEYLEELRQQAQGHLKRSVILKELKKEQIPEQAHRQLLTWKKVEERWNPFPPRFVDALKNADVAVSELPDEERVDLTGVTSYAIDDAGSRDPDDAIAWDGTYFWVHIADAAAVITPGSEADLEARSRGGNLYLPEGTVTMLPPEVTDKLALGLQPDRSPAISFRYLLDNEGNVEEGKIFLSWVKVERISYQDCNERMEESPFKEMDQLMDIFRQKRLTQGAIQIDMPEVKTRVDEQGEIHITSLPKLRSREMVAEAMMLTGSWVASFCLNLGLPIPYASQPTPDEEVPQGKEMSVMMGRRRIMQRSRISLTPSRHSGLGLDLYTRATSPLRRYSDLVVMQQLRRHLKGEEPLSEEEITHASALYEAQSSSLSSAERQSNMHWKLVYLCEHPDWIGEAVLAAKTERQGHFVIPQLALEGRIPMKEKKELDSRARIQVQKIDFPANMINFKVIEWL